MEQRRSGIAYFALVVAIVALVLSVIAYTRRGQPQATPAPRSPATITLSMVVATFSGQGMTAHRWYPTMLVVRRGDTVDLAVANPDEFNHGLELTGYNLKTKKLAPGSSDTLHFLADQPGVVEYRCAVPHNPATRDCTPDHDLMRGYLIVTD
jgi:uncharacterized cupredoxin-like copper-binding protein